MRTLHFLLFVPGLLISGLHAYKDISADTLMAWMTNGTKFDFIQIDVRPIMPAIIANDSCRPYHLAFYRGDLEANLDLLPKHVPLVLTCNSGVTSVDASIALDSLGYTCFNLLGGINQWPGTTRDYELIRPLSDLPEPSMRAHPDFSGFENIDCDTLLQWMTEGTSFDFILLDIRDSAELDQVIA